MLSGIELSESITILNSLKIILNPLSFQIVLLKLIKVLFHFVHHLQILQFLKD